MAKLNWVRRIYDDGMHCAFTDMTKWKEQYYVSFRRAECHGLVPGGDIFIIRSPDLESWEVCGRFTSGLDDRDAALAPDGDRLWAYAAGRYVTTTFVDGAVRLDPQGEAWLQTYAYVTTDGETWSVGKPVYERQFWLWRPYKFGDAFYCACRNLDVPSADRVLDLVKSDEGLHWGKVTRMMERGGGEAAMVRFDDGRILCASRGADNDPLTNFHEAEPPYTSWSHWSAPHWLQGPALVRVGDRVIGAGRVRMADGGPGGVTALFEITPDQQRSQHLMDLPSGGDTSYCGLLAEGDDTLLVTYYSEHEYMDRPDFVHTQKPAAIYLAQVSF